MRNVYEVLQEKESAIQRVTREVEMLRLVAPLLSDDDTPSRDAPSRDEHLIAYNRPPNEEGSTHYSPIQDAHEDEVNTGIVSEPSLLTSDPNNSDPNNEDVEDRDDANSLPGQKISRLKKLVRPFVSLVAG